MPTFHIDGLKELAEAMAEELPKATSTNVVKRALGRAADPIEQDAQAAAPHLTGKLQRSFTTSSKLSPHQREVTVKESKVEVYVGPAALVQAITSEFGTAHQAPRPFMRPAWDNNKLGIKPPSAKLDQIDVTHMQSPGRRREFITGLIDSGEASFEMNFIPGSASDQRLNSLLTLPVGISRRRSCRISFPNGVTWTFDAELTGYDPAIPFDGKMTAAVKFKVTGQPVIGST
jgi:HK97 gp10 family phage protein